MFSVCSHLGGGQVQGGSGPATGGGQVQLPGGGVRSSCRGGSGPAAGGVRSRGGQVQPAGGGQVQPGGVSILRPLAGGMPLAFTQKDFLVCGCD